MKKSINKSEVKKKIEEFFQRKDFAPEQLKKVRRIAMKFNIKLGDYRKSFCKRCLHPLSGKIAITKTHKTTICKHCGFRNKIRIS